MLRRRRALLGIGCMRRGRGSCANPIAAHEHSAACIRMRLVGAWRLASTGSGLHEREAVVGAIAAVAALHASQVRADHRRPDARSRCCKLTPSLALEEQIQCASILVCTGSAIMQHTKCCITQVIGSMLETPHDT